MSVALAQLQKDFLAALLDGEVPRCAVSPPDAIDFYRGSVQATWGAALAAAYPVVRRLVGPAFFLEAARAYGQRHPSTSGDLHRLGDRFAGFIEDYAPAADLPYLADVARLEWALHECALAADGRAFDFAALAAIPAADHGRLTARLAPGTRCLRSPHPILAIHEANRPERDGVPERLHGPDHVLVHRVGGDATATRVEEVAWCLLDALARGEDLEHAAQRLGEHAARMPALLAGWTAAGVIEALEPGVARG